MNTICFPRVTRTALALDVVCPTAVEAIMQVPKMIRIQTAAISPRSYPLWSFRVSFSLCFPVAFCMHTPPYELMS